MRVVENRLLALGTGGLGRLCCGQPGGQVSGERGQVHVGPHRERLAHPLIKFVPGEHALQNAALRVPTTCSRSACEARR